MARVPARRIHLDPHDRSKMTDLRYDGRRPWAAADDTLATWQEHIDEPSDVDVTVEFADGYRIGRTLPLEPGGAATLATQLWLLLDTTPHSELPDDWQPLTSRYQLGDTDQRAADLLAAYLAHTDRLLLLAVRVPRPCDGLVRVQMWTRAFHVEVDRDGRYGLPGDIVASTDADTYAFAAGCPVEFLTVG